MQTGALETAWRNTAYSGQSPHPGRSSLGSSGCRTGSEFGSNWSEMGSCQAPISPHCRASVPREASVLFPDLRTPFWLPPPTMEYPTLHVRTSLHHFPREEPFSPPQPPSCTSPVFPAEGPYSWSGPAWGHGLWGSFQGD